MSLKWISEHCLCLCGIIICRSSESGWLEGIDRKNLKVVKTSIGTDCTSSFMVNILLCVVLAQSTDTIHLTWMTSNVIARTQKEHWHGNSERVPFQCMHRYCAFLIQQWKSPLYQKNTTIKFSEVLHDGSTTISCSTYIFVSWQKTV